MRLMQRVPNYRYDLHFQKKGYGELMKVRKGGLRWYDFLSSFAVGRKAERKGESQWLQLQAKDFV